MRPTIKISQEDYTQLILRIFNTEDGKTLLNAWEDLFIYRPVAMGGDDMIELGKRQGEFSFVLSIVNLIEQHKQGEL